MLVVDWVEIIDGGREVKLKAAKHNKGNETARMRSCVEDSGELKDGENADKVGGEVEDGEEVENGERLEDGNDDDTGTETGEGDVDDKGGDIQT